MLAIIGRSTLFDQNQCIANQGTMRGGSGERVSR